MPHTEPLPTLTPKPAILKRDGGCLTSELTGRSKRFHITVNVTRAERLTCPPVALKLTASAAKLIICTAPRQPLVFAIHHADCHYLSGLP